MLVWAFVLIACGRGTAGDAPLERHVGFPGSTMLALAGDQLLLWGPNGRAELRTGPGAWSALKLPIARVFAAQADAEGFLIAGADSDGSGVVVAASPLGKERMRWSVAGGALGVAAHARPPRALTRAGIVALNPDGTTGVVEPYPSGRGLSVLLPREGGDALCTPADVSKAHHAPGVCTRAGTSPWDLEADFVEAPLSCGDWVVTGDGFEPGGMETRSLAAYGWDSGAAGGNAAFPVHPAVACAGPGELLVGEKRLALLRLPGFDVGWSHPVEGAAPVREVAVLENLFAYRVDGSLEVVLLPRPRR